MLPRLRAPLLIALVGLLAAVVDTASAQAPARDRVQSALDATDARIRQAEEVVASADLPRAQVELDAAVEMQGRARASFTGAQLTLSLKLTLDARGHADRAIAIVRGLPDPDRVRAQIERSREMIERARERIEECDRPRALALITSALSMQSRSEDHMAAGRYLAALQLSMSARERALRALRVCELREDQGDAAERALQRTDALIARAIEAIADQEAPLARGALERAQRLQEQSRSEFSSGRSEAALRLTQSARAFAHRAIRLGSTGN